MPLLHTLPLIDLRRTVVICGQRQKRRSVTGSDFSTEVCSVPDCVRDVVYELNTNHEDGTAETYYLCERHSRERLSWLEQN